MAIQKLKGKEHDNGIYTTIECSASNSDLFQKVNELIDVVNALVEENNIHEKQIDELQMKEPVDKFAEQKRWIGKLCRFWDDEEDCHFSILVDVLKCAPYPYCCKGDWWYKHCEPVLPDNDRIYKGE